MFRTLTAAALALLLTSCSFRQPEVGTGGVKPYAGNFFCATNPSSDQRAVIFAEAHFTSFQLGRGRADQPVDDVYRAMEVRQARPNQRVCFRWPWVSDEGRIGIVVGRDTTYGSWFNPWTQQ